MWKRLERTAKNIRVGINRPEEEGVEMEVTRDSKVHAGTSGEGRWGTLK